MEGDGGLEGETSSPEIGYSGATRISTVNSGDSLESSSLGSTK